MPHRGHPDCIYTSKAACEQARRVAMGQCQEMSGSREPTPCARWATEEIDGRKVCGQHANMLVLRVDHRRREQLRLDDLNRRIDEYLAWVAEHPHVWDSRV